MYSFFSLLCHEHDMHSFLLLVFNLLCGANGQSYHSTWSTPISTPHPFPVQHYRNNTIYSVSSITILSFTVNVPCGSHIIAPAAPPSPPHTPLLPVQHYRNNTIYSISSIRILSFTVNVPCGMLKTEATVSLSFFDPALM